MFVYGDSLQSYLIAIVVVDQIQIEKEEGVSKKEIPSYIKTKEFEDKIYKWFQDVKKDQKLTSLEVPKKIYCTTDDFKVEDGTLTPTFKLVRAEAKNKHYDKIKELYDGAKLQGE